MPMNCWNQTPSLRNNDKTTRQHLPLKATCAALPTAESPTLLRLYSSLSKYQILWTSYDQLSDLRQSHLRLEFYPKFKSFNILRSTVRLRQSYLRLDLIQNPYLSMVRFKSKSNAKFWNLQYFILRMIWDVEWKWSQYECGNITLRALKLRTLLSQFKSKTLMRLINDPNIMLDLRGIYIKPDIWTSNSTPKIMLTARADSLIKNNWMLLDVSNSIQARDLRLRHAKTYACAHL